MTIQEFIKNSEEYNKFKRTDDFNGYKCYDIWDSANEGQ